MPKGLRRGLFDRAIQGRRGVGRPSDTDSLIVSPMV
jgi:hypothetical protein